MLVLLGKKDGVDKYWLEIWVPGHMEMIVNHPHKENVNNYTQIGQRLLRHTEERKAPMAAGIFPVGTGAYACYTYRNSY